MYNRKSAAAGAAAAAAGSRKASKVTVETETVMAENVNAGKKQCQKCFNWYSRLNRHMSEAKSCKE